MNIVPSESRSSSAAASVSRVSFMKDLLDWRAMGCRGMNNERS